MPSAAPGSRRPLQSRRFRRGAAGAAVMCAVVLSLSPAVAPRAAAAQSPTGPRAAGPTRAPSGASAGGGAPSRFTGLTHHGARSGDRARPEEAADPWQTAVGAVLALGLAFTAERIKSRHFAAS